MVASFRAHKPYYEKEEELLQRSFLVSDSHGRVSMKGFLRMFLRVSKNVLVRGFLYCVFLMLLAEYKTVNVCTCARRKEFKVTSIPVFIL